ncbi:NUDIX domain-containing protein [Cytobacillus sp. IB215665]|uniref:NUDIX domain-containing protein n=1 Tax=Cytobacillus sp. IB215665 TaxID=3097357 RepID=UPI002A13B5ED|nr:NUDIX domain-containing protein [Cytobacillus sp. IB215665]MDX8365836.1 NUDIX domain-containing protein [Cytobacillus sp. IB215665]
MEWEESYLGNLRTFVGNQKLIIPSVRAIIENEDGKILFVERSGEGKWGMPAGSIELNESIHECLVREVKEETGLYVLSSKAIAVYTNQKYSNKNKYGDEYQLFEFLFLVDKWTGSIKKNTYETSNAKFFSPNNLPTCTNEFWTSFHKDVIADLKLFKVNSQFILK